MGNNDRSPSVVADLMSTDLVTVHSSDSVGRARDLLAAIRIHALPVVEDGRIIGILTSADLADYWPDDQRVSKVMTAAPYRISGNAAIEDAAREMLARQVHHLIVDEPGGSVGILSSFDLLRALTLGPRAL
jgi:CBS domain-containing protein